MAKQYQIFLLESENPSDIPSYLKMLSPLQWSILTFSKPTDFIQTILAGTKPDIIIANYNIPLIPLKTYEGEVNVTNSLKLIEILINSKKMEKCPTVLLLNQQHGVDEYQNCNSNSIPYLTKGKFEVIHLVDLLQKEVRSYYKDSTDYLHILQYGNTPIVQSPLVQSSLDLVGTPMLLNPSQFDLATSHTSSNPQEPVKKVAEVLSFHNGGKGGVGKTTTSTSFAVLLASAGSKVLLIDADFFAPNCHFLLKVKPTRTIIDLKHNLNNLTESSFRDCIINHITGLDFLPGPNNPKDCELLFSDDIYKIIKFAKEYYEYIIIDLPPKLPDESHLVDAISHLSDKIIEVTTQGYSSINGATKSFQLLASEGIDPNKFFICVNGLNPKINFDPESISTSISAKQEYVSQLKNKRIPVVGKIGSDDNLPMYESMMELYILNTKTKYRKDMEHMVMNLIPNYKFNNSGINHNVNKKQMKSSQSFLSKLLGTFSNKK
jgi:MinD-like ATPase involved in chromosome partitioning or flagellar assembly